MLKYIKIPAGQMAPKHKAAFCTVSVFSAKTKVLGSDSILYSKTRRPNQHGPWDTDRFWVYDDEEFVEGFSEPKSNEWGEICP